MSPDSLHWPCCMRSAFGGTEFQRGNTTPFSVDVVNVMSKSLDEYLDSQKGSKSQKDDSYSINVDPPLLKIHSLTPSTPL